MKDDPVKCPHNRIRGTVCTQGNLQSEVDHLVSVLTQTGYHANFIHSTSAPYTQKAGISSQKRTRRVKTDQLW